MAWRIDESIIRGEIDNRTRGRVTGRLWLVGRTDPVELKLTGNAWRDLAGRRLEFTNPDPKPGDFDGLNLLQHGSIGDLTASRKVKVPEIPMDQIGVYYAAKKPFPWHWGNSLYLEWFSESNGRVVIESASYELKIVGEPTWDMSAAEEEKQRHENADATNDFMAELSTAAEAESESSAEEVTDPTAIDDDDEPATWSEKPQTEKEAEQMHAESDRLVDRIQARMAREGHGADYAKILDEEIQRLRHERGEPDPTPEQLARHAEWIEAMNLAGQDAAEDPDLDDEEDPEHPLAGKAYELTLRLMEETKERGWLTDQTGEEHPIAELVHSVSKAAAKFAGALNGPDWPPDLDDCASTIVRLKKARVYLDDALLAMESRQEQKLTPNNWLAVAMVEVIDLAHEADIIIAELRERLERNAE